MHCLHFDSIQYKIKRVRLGLGFDGKIGKSAKTATNDVSGALRADFWRRTTTSEERAHDSVIVLAPPRMLLSKILLLVGALCLSVLGANGANNEGLEVAGAQIEWLQDSSCTNSSDGIHNTSASSGNQTSAPSHQIDKTNKYEHVGWDELSKEAREAATTLGYDKSFWDDGALPGIINVLWEDLSEQQVAAVTALGWDSNSWNTKHEEMKWMSCQEHEKIPDAFEEVESFHSHYQDIEVFYGKDENDVCLFLDNYLHT